MNAPASLTEQTEKAQQIVAYKAFDENLACRGHKFKVGETYTVEGKPVICDHGFHACENPLDVLNYYDLCGSRFARVTISGEVDRREGDSKLCGASITIDAELSLPEWIGASIKWLIAACKSDDKVQAASGYSSQLAASGDSSQLAASGDSSKLAASGYYSKLAASGDSSKLAASGDCSQLAASGDYSKLAASGDCSQLAASGDYSKLAASGDYSKLAASGDYSKLAASGGFSKLEITGKNSAAASVGNGSRIKAAKGCPIAICEYDRHGKPIGFATGIAGKAGIPADTWLIAKNGVLVEVGQ